MQNEIDRLQEEYNKEIKILDEWVDVFAEEIDLLNYIRIETVLQEPENVAGIDISKFKGIVFEEKEVDFLNTPLWVDKAIDVCRNQISLNRMGIHREADAAFEERTAHHYSED